MNLEKIVYENVLEQCNYWFTCNNQQKSDFKKNDQINTSMYALKKYSNFVVQETPKQTILLN